jgi:hypothetical protein
LEKGFGSHIVVAAADTLYYYSPFHIFQKETPTLTQAGVHKSYIVIYIQAPAFIH